MDLDGLILAFPPLLMKWPHCALEKALVVTGERTFGKMVVGCTPRSTMHSGAISLKGVERPK